MVVYNNHLFFVLIKFYLILANLFTGQNLITGFPIIYFLLTWTVYLFIVFFFGSNSAGRIVHGTGTLVIDNIHIMQIITYNSAELSIFAVCFSSVK